MTKELILEIINRHLILEPILLIICGTISWVVFLKLGLQMMKVDLKIRAILPGAALGSLVNLFLKPLVPGIVNVIILVVPLILSLKFYGKAKWSICCWITFLLLIISEFSTMLFLSPLNKVNPNTSTFFQTIPGVMVGTIIETALVAIVLMILRVSNLSLLPSPEIFINGNFLDIFIFGALFYGCYRTTISLYEEFVKHPGNIQQSKMIDWLVAFSAVLAFYVKKIFDRKKYERIEKKQTELTNKIEELKNDLNATQPNSGTLPKAYLLLDPREREVLKLVALGMPIKAIAAQLYLDKNTVSSYIKRICDKLEIEKAHLPVYAFAIGIISKEDCNIKDELTIKVK